MKRVSSAPIASLFAPDGNEPGPLHEQLYNKLREQIVQGHFSPGQRMPSTRMLAADLRVSRNTILHAFDQLKAEGYLEGSVGSGTYVARIIPEHTIEVRRNLPSIDSQSLMNRSLSCFGSRITSATAKAFRPAPYCPFQIGFPALDAFPFHLWTKLYDRYRKSGAIRLLGYNTAAGYEPLRKAIAAYLAVARGVRCEPEQVIIVSGTQQALDLTARLLLDPKDPVVIEEPSYRGAHIAFEGAAATLIPASVNQDGIDLAPLLSAGIKPRLIYTTPSHQFPLGTTMSANRRRELIRWATEAGAWILEDDYDSEFRYASRPMPTLQSLDQTGCVIFLGTFSKVLFPALRLGYLVVPPTLVDAFTRAKALTDFHCPTLDQAVTADFLEQGHFNRHIRRMRALYLQRLDTLLEAVRADMNDALEIERPDAGMHVLARMDSQTDDVALSEKAFRAGLSCMPLSSLYIGPNKNPGLLLGFAGYRPQQIRSGIRKLSSILSKRVPCDLVAV